VATARLPLSNAPAEEETSRDRLRRIAAGFWPLAIGLVALYLFLLALGAIDPDEATGLTIGAIGLVVLLVAHVAMRVYSSDEPTLAQRSDRERRGF
jgi:cell division protein FtsW (lipid II flippase)